MNETELETPPAATPAVTDNAPAQVESAASTTASDPSSAERPNMGVDLATRPDGVWLTTVANELDDTDFVLKCLAGDSAKICQTCDAAQASGELDSRPMLARCASTKLPR